MDARLPLSREELYNLQMEVKQVQYTQSSHAERLLRLEKRNADESSIKSVWNSPFPGVLAGTPSQGPVQIPHNDVFDDLDEQGDELLGSLHLGPAEEEPVRRGAASRANSVRFDESALHGSSWAAQSNRHSGDFGPTRPGSGFMMERSLSHKSDGRHSSAGHSVHSHHSVASGRASSLGLDTNYAGGDDESSSFDIPGPPVSLFVLGSVPSIIRCWLTTNYAHGTLLYADICSGSQKSLVEYSLLKELDLLEEIERDADGVYRIRLNVYLAEAVATRHENRSNASGGAVPCMSVTFEVTGTEQSTWAGDRKRIRIFVGSDALRAHSADILLSQNTMVLCGSEQERLRVPFVRPEDENAFRHICTTNVAPEKPKLNATATPFVFGDASGPQSERLEAGTLEQPPEKAEVDRPRSPHDLTPGTQPLDEMNTSHQSDETDSKSRETIDPAGSSSKDDLQASEQPPREPPASGIWGSWRQPGGDGSQREVGSLSGYQPAARSSRNMKVLKPFKSNSGSARPGAPYEPAPSSKSNDGRRKSQVSLNGDAGAAGNVVPNRWDAKRSVSSAAELKSPTVGKETKEGQKGTGLAKAANPVGVASAFSWMKPASKPSPNGE